MKLENIFIAFAGVALLLITFYALPSAPEGFWSKYSYTPPANNLTQAFGSAGDMNGTTSSLACVANTGNATNCPEPSALDAITFVQRMVNKGYAGIITIFQLIGISEVMITDAAKLVGIPPAIISLAITLLIVFMSLAIIMFIFNRSDT